MAVLIATHITSANAYSSLVLSKCSSNAIANNKCDYLADDLSFQPAKIVSSLVGDACFASGKNGSNTSNYWDVAGWCVENGSGHDSMAFAADYCDMNYNALVWSKNDSENIIYWACACQRDKSFVEWRTYSTSVMRRYKQTAGYKCAITATATSEYKCAPGYYGPGNSTTGCKVCPANATCSGNPDSNNVTRFICNTGYYNNAANNGCVECPDSKAGGLGWDANGNGIKAYYSGSTIEECAIQDGTRLYDSKGTFLLDSGDDNEDCFYIK